jgi:hypothetical protein
MSSKKQYERVASIPTVWRSTTVIVTLVAFAVAAASYYIFENKLATKIILAAAGVLAVGVGLYFYKLQVQDR